jgi:hypothetical protein
MLILIKPGVNNHKGVTIVLAYNQRIPAVKKVAESTNE